MNMLQIGSYENNAKIKRGCIHLQMEVGMEILWLDKFQMIKDFI